MFFALGQSGLLQTSQQVHPHAHARNLRLTSTSRFVRHEQASTPRLVSGDWARERSQLTS